MSNRQQIANQLLAFIFIISKKFVCSHGLTKHRRPAQRKAVQRCTQPSFNLTGNMTATEPVYIPLNKRRLAGLLRLTTSFIIAGLWLASAIRLNHSLFVVIIASLGIAQLIFFTPLAFSLFQKRKDKKAGITVDRTGITDNTILSAGHIPWSDIQEIKKTRGQLLIIFVSNPTIYIGRQSNFLKRKLMKMMLKTYGSPIILGSNELRSDFAELQDMLQTALKKNKPEQGE